MFVSSQMGLVFVPGRKDQGTDLTIEYLMVVRASIIITGTIGQDIRAISGRCRGHGSNELEDKGQKGAISHEVRGVT